LWEKCGNFAKLAHSKASWLAVAKPTTSIDHPTSQPITKTFGKMRAKRKSQCLALATKIQPPYLANFLKMVS